MDSPIHIARENEFYQGYIRFKMSVSNESSYVVNDITLDFVFDESLLHIAEHGDYPLKNGKLVLGNIYGGKSKTITILFEPLTCAKAADIRCQVNYADHEGNMAYVFMEPKEISVVCPIMKTDQDINIGRLKDLIENLPSKDSRAYEVQSGFNVQKLVTLAREVVEKHDIWHIRTLQSRDGKTCEVWHYGRTKIKEHDIVMRTSILTEYNTVELFAATQTAEALTGLLAEIGRDLKQTMESKASGQGRVINLSIKDSVVQRSNLLDMCNIDGTCDVNVVIVDSVVQHSGIGTADEETRLLREREKREEAERLRREQEERKRLEQEELERRRVEAEKKKDPEGKPPGEQNFCAFCGRKILFTPHRKNNRWWCGSCTTSDKEIHSQPASSPRKTAPARVEKPHKKRRSRGKVLFLIILVVAGYWMFSPLMADNSYVRSLENTDNVQFSTGIVQLPLSHEVEIGGGYTLKLMQSDFDSGRAWLQCSQYGEFIDDEIISSRNPVPSGSKPEWQLPFTTKIIVSLIDISSDNEQCVVKLTGEGTISENNVPSKNDVISNEDTSANT